MSDTTDMTIDEALSDLVGKLAMGEPIWPCPRYPQDVAFLAFTIKELREAPATAGMTFAEAWKMTGYQYGKDERENVELGWELAKGTWRP